MTITRRDFLKAGTTGAASFAALAGLPRPLLAQLGGPRPEPASIEDPRLKDLAARGLDAARRAGATYADTRLTHSWTRGFEVGGSEKIWEMQALTVGVRALANGHWGFASGPVWSPDEMARLGREAAHQAQVNAAIGKARAVDLAPVPAVRDGQWVMPVKIDGFGVHPLEVVDYLRSLALFLSRIPGARVQENRCSFDKQEKAFASTDGSYCTQRTYRTAGTFTFNLVRDHRRGGGGLDLLTPAGVGWELYRDQPLRERLRQLIEVAAEDMKLPVKPVDVGRYDTVMDAFSLANLVAGTLRPATELDRALGYEANAGGTSYLNDPFAMVGTFQAAAPIVTVTANRSEPGGAATVRWDDEGVAPDEFPIVQEGTLVDFQTTRESAGWLKEYYAKRGKPLRSHGCAAAPEAVDAPIQHAPNVLLQPGREAQDFDALVTGVAAGIAIRGIGVDMDFQSATGMGMGTTYEIKGGKRIALLNAAGVLFRSTELWKAVLALGGKESLCRYGLQSEKGEPGQRHYSSITVPPAVFKQLTTIDALRKA
jgi:TldD protein